MAQIIAWPDGPDAVLLMRAADAAPLAIPGCWRRMSQVLRQLAARAEQRELRWHLTQMAARLDLTEAGRRAWTACLWGWLEDRSVIVPVSALTRLAAWADEVPGLRVRLEPGDAAAGGAADRSRARPCQRPLRDQALKRDAARGNAASMTTIRAILRR